jgi:hypothetical protein
VHDEAGGELRAPTDADLTNERQFTRWSDEQEKLSPDAFYARMSALVNPHGLEPERAYESTLDALVEQLETRVRSVDNGEQFVREHPRTVISMPEGPAIFETSGPWEDYATPSRDFRLIIAINVLEALPARIERHPELFVLGTRTPDSARAEVGRLHAQRSAGAHHHLHPERRLALAAHRRGRDRAQGRLRDRLRPERLRRGALGCAGRRGRACDLQAPRPCRAASADGGLSELVP